MATVATHAHRIRDTRRVSIARASQLYAEQDKPITKADYEALALYRYAIRRYLRFSEDAVRNGGHLPRQYQLLLAIKGYPGRQYANVGELAERLQLDHHSTVGLVDRAQQSGLVRRRQDASDRRQVNVCLTSEGEALLERLAQVHRAELVRMRLDSRPPGFED